MRKLPIGIQTSLHRFGKRSLIPYQSDRRDIVKVCMEFAEEQNITDGYVNNKTITTTAEWTYTLYTSSLMPPAPLPAWAVAPSCCS